MHCLGCAIYLPTFNEIIEYIRCINNNDYNN